MNTNVNKYLWTEVFKKKKWESENILPTYNVICFEKYHLKKNKSSQILDVGCGTGANSIYLASKNNKVIGVDISSKAISACKRKVSNKDLNISFQVGSSTSLEFADSTFDAVFCDGVLYYNEKLDYLKSINEMYRVLKKNGILRVYTKSNRDSYAIESNKVSSNTYLVKKGYEKGMIIHCLPKKNVYKYFKNFRNLTLGLEEFDYINYKNKKSFWIVTAIK